MKIILSALSACVLMGCASTTPSSRLVVMEEMRPLSRDEVILGIEECESANARAVVTRAPIKVGSASVNVAVDVTCSPRYQLRRY